jgi:nicotinamidase/pyrazinamidase
MSQFPSFYDPNKVGTLYVPNTQQAIAEGAALGLSFAESDNRKVLLLLVDPQVDFIHTDGSLSVPGAVDDTQRTIEWIFRNVSQLTAVSASLDSHVPVQIFYPSWWEDANGNEPAPFTAVTADDVDNKIWRPRYEGKWSVDYVHKLASQAKKDLMIWPYHTMLGTPGHSVTPALYEAIAYATAARGTQPEFLFKGSIPKTENYSIMEPEVKVPGHPQGGVNTTFLDYLAEFDLVYVAGQAKSHCVLETLISVFRYFENQPDVIARIRILMDAMSSVYHPDVDFEAIAMVQYRDFEARGARLVTTSDPIG